MIHVVELPREADELGRLFESYERLLRCTGTPRGLGVRLCPGLHHYAIEHARRTITALLAHYSVQLAHAETEACDTARRRLERFANALPPARSGLWPLVPLAAIAIVAQILSPIGASVGPIADRVKQIAAVATLDPTKLSDATYAVLHSSLFAVMYIGWVFALATLIVLWPRRRAFRVYRSLIGVDPPFLGVQPLRISEREIREREREIFARVDEELPDVGSFDLYVSACGAVVLGLMSADLLAFIVSGYDDTWQEWLLDGLLGSGLAIASAAILVSMRLRLLRRRRDATA